MKAVDKRASELNGEYISKARNTDRQYCGTALDATGPVETKLASMGEVKGVVVGAFGEGSEDLHSLIHHLAISRSSEGGGPPEGEEGAGADRGGRVGNNHLFLEANPVYGRSQGPSKAFAWQAGGDWPGCRGGCRAAQLCPQS